LSHTFPINLTSLDADTLKTSFIAWLKTQAIFKDYDYTGSNINVLLDLLSKNSSLNAFLLHMVASEAFLDTAQIRDSVVSKAKELNYIPRSWRSAEALLNIVVNVANAAPTVVTIPAGTSFSARVDDDVFTFTTDKSLSSIPSQYIAATNTYVYSFANVAIYEGPVISESFFVNNSIENQRFVLTNEQIDTRSIVVTIKESNTATTNSLYIATNTLKSLKNDSNVFFVQATSNNKYEVLFGDGVLGRKPTTGNIVDISYRVASGDDANGADTFKLTSNSMGGYSTYTINTVSSSRGGAEQESIESIRFNAPRHYQTQESAVTYLDYETLISQAFPEIRTLHVYGGEEVSPPKYGRILISVDIENFDGISSAQKTAIENFIRPKMVATFIPQVVEPEYLYLHIELDAEYSTTKTQKSAEDIKTLITDAITEFNSENLQDFHVKFRYAELGTTINEADESIVGTDLTVGLYKIVLPDLNTAYKATMQFQNALEKSSIYSSAFVYNDISGLLQDDGEGNLNIVSDTASNNTILAKNVGSVDYTTGEIKISNLNISEYTGSEIRIFAATVKQDISVDLNTILGVGLDYMHIDVSAVVS
jgi:hypothetical protein